MNHNIKISGIKFLLSALIMSIGIFQSKAQKIELPEEPLSSVRIAALYIPSTIIKSAELMPEADYPFRPTPDVRSFGELMGHIAESNFEMCAIAKGEKPPVLKVGVTKNEVLNALKKSFAYLSESYENMTKEQAEKIVSFMGNRQPAGNVLDFSVFHSLQHYGTVIVYLRLKGIVPPSSEPNVK